MRWTVTLFFVLIFLFAGTPIYSQYVIKGRLLGTDGQPMKRADIVWVSNYDGFPRDILEKFSVKNDGAFEFDTHRAGVHRIWFCGVGHISFRIPFYMEKPDTIIVTVNLENAYKNNINKITLKAGQNKIDYKYLLTDTLIIENNKPVIKEYLAYSDSFTYEMNQTGTRNYFSGTMADNYIFDCGKSFEEKYNYYYIAYIKTEKGTKFKLEFSPAQLPSDTNKSIYSFQRVTDKTLKFLKVHEYQEFAMDKYHNFATQAYKDGKDNDFVNSYNWDKDIEYLDEQIKREKDSFLKNSWIVSRISLSFFAGWGKPGIKMSKQFAQMALDNITPDSPLWSYFSIGIGVAIGQATQETKKMPDLKSSMPKLQLMEDPYLDYLLTSLNYHPDPTIKLNTYKSLLSRASKLGRVDITSTYLIKLQEEYKGNRRLESILNEYSPKRAIKEGNIIPPFEFKSALDTTKVITDKSMLGKKYLIDIWASWCHACAPQYDALKNLYDRFNGKSFNILGVSICFTADDMLKFQQKHPMPWFNAHKDINREFNGFMKDFEVTAIPKYILVDETGKILAVNDLDKILSILSGKK